MRKKIIGYNFFTFFFSLIHVIFSAFFFRIDFLVILRIYIFLLPFSSFLFFLCLLASIKKYKLTVYVLCSIIKLFFGVFVFVYLMIEYDYFSNSLRAFANFIFSYFMILFFRIVFLLI